MGQAQCRKEKDQAVYKTTCRNFVLFQQKQLWPMPKFKIAAKQLLFVSGMIYADSGSEFRWHQIYLQQSICLSAHKLLTITIVITIYT